MQAARFQQAVRLYQQGELAQARDACVATLQAEPRHADAIHLLGLIAFQAKQNSLALELINRAIDIAPDQAVFYSNQGNVLHVSGQLPAALESYDHALALKPDFAELWSNRSNVLVDLERYQDALESADCALKQKPACIEAWNNRGNALQGMKRLEEALESFNRALALKPGYAEAWNNRGNALRDLNQPDAALESFDRALALNPDYFEAWVHRGNALRDLYQFQAAVSAYDHAITLAPDFPEARWNKALTLLLCGDFEQGWALYEWRWRCKNGPRHPDFSQTLWLGNVSLQGKTLLLYAEQGFGDVLQFCRYAKVLAKQGARVILLVPQSLIGLLQSLEGVEQIISERDPHPPVDYRCPLLSLPLACKTTLDTIPADSPYLQPNKQKVQDWNKTLGKRALPRVGLIWRGSSAHHNDHNRSIRLAEWLALLPTGIQYVSLQKEIDETERKVLREHPEVMHVGDALEDFSDTAAVIETLDVVVSVDTSVLHLAAALGKPVWGLLPFVPDFRWLLNRDDSPWYPTLRLFRQHRRGDWADVMQQINCALQALAGRFGDA